MLRGVITRINGVPAREVGGDHWVLSGDRGVTYSATPPPDTELVDGEWWPADYSGPPQVSFAAEEAAEIGLKLDDMITINILGCDIEARLTSTRVVDFSTAGIGFILSLNPAALAGAPHTHIATVYAAPSAEATILRDLARAFPNITAIRVGDAIARVSDVLERMAYAITLGAGATLVTGFIVLIGAAAAGHPARVYEAAVLKTLGGGIPPDPDKLRLAIGVDGGRCRSGRAAGRRDRRLGGDAVCDGRGFCDQLVVSPWGDCHWGFADGFGRSGLRLSRVEKSTSAGSADPSVEREESQPAAVNALKTIRRINTEKPVHLISKSLFVHGLTNGFADFFPLAANG